ncbi:YeeE/YedE family protein [Pseudazoarcus pumilus]|uniref:Transporter n=1 Tax=Pseudazoarcus pumilus TaxID=2067960 RepID=A0A2I6S9E4_9RHOO|nr:YeeE/YedE family protein [Pseudazoarcus pumilus]AUN95851.1 transporter [Pseudazoarcus pumilus]
MFDEPVVAASTIAWIAFALGLVFGYAGNRSNFCTMGAVSDIVNMGDWTRMRMWAAAVGVAILGTAALQLTGVLDTDDSIYTGSRVIWFSNLLGGALFGIGMTLASGCGSKTLIRIGGGNLKSLIVFVFLGISAYMTMRGLFGVWRTQYIDTISFELSTSQDLPSILAGLGLARETALVALAAVIGGGLLVFTLLSREARQLETLLGAIAIGAVCVAGWYVTAHVGFVEEHPRTLERAFIGTNSGQAESFTFVAPVGYTLELFMLWSDTSRIFTFGIAGVLGVIAGSAVYAATSRTWRVESFMDAGDLVRHIVGAILMGFGGVTAFGCTIGQGVTGFSTLAVGSLLTTAAIIAGAAVTMKVQYWLMMRED